MTDERKIILASGSPRRFELMTRIGFVPRVIKPDILEEKGRDEIPQAYTERLAKEKAFAAMQGLEGSESWILSADTIVVLDHEVLEKPIDEKDAIQMLSRMSGCIHQVITSFCWLNRHTEKYAVHTVIAEVEMIRLSKGVIEAYVATGEPMDKAGSYGIQAIGATLVRRIEGSYFAVMGLPTCEVVESLRALNGLTNYPFPEANSTEGG